MSQSSRCTTRKAWSEAKALACHTTRGMAGTTTRSMLLERSCGREMEMHDVRAVRCEDDAMSRDQEDGI